MWPEPRDLAFIVAAIVAGSFTRLSSLNSRDSDISKLKSEWMSVFREEIANLCSYALMGSAIKSQIKSSNKDLKEEFDNETYSELRALQNKLTDAAEKFQRSRYLIKTKVNMEKSDQKEVMKAIESVRGNLRISADEYDEDKVKEMHGLINNVVHSANEFNKNEWISLKAGDSGIRKKLKKQNKILIWTLIIYALYVGVFSVAKSIDFDKEKEIVVSSTEQVSAENISVNKDED